METTTKQAIAYCRLACEEQTGTKVGLAMQKESIKNAAAERGVELVKLFKAFGSGEANLEEVLKYCKAHRNVKYLLATSPDRISRSMEQWVKWTLKFNEQGIVLKFTN